MKESKEPFAKQSIMNKMMKSCYQATELISLEQEQPLSLKQKFQMYNHIMVCKGCRSFYKNSHTLSDMIRSHKAQQKVQSIQTQDGSVSGSESNTHPEDSSPNSNHSEQDSKNQE